MKSQGCTNEKEKSRDGAVGGGEDIRSGGLKSE